MYLAKTENFTPKKTVDFQEFFKSFKRPKFHKESNGGMYVNFVISSYPHPTTGKDVVLTSSMYINKDGIIYMALGKNTKYLGYKLTNIKID